MNATEQDISILRKLQEADRKVLSAKKEFQNLPHREAILEVRTKKDEILKKKVQVQDMLDNEEGKLTSLVQEDEQLATKQEEITAELAEVQGDYRAVTSKTRELDGVRKRREKVALELSRVEEQVNKINPVMNQIMSALTTMEEKEKQLVESFQKTGGSLSQGGGRHGTPDFEFRRNGTERRCAGDDYEAKADLQPSGSVFGTGDICGL